MSTNLHDFLKQHGPAAIVSAIGTAVFCFTYISQFYCEPQLKTLRDANETTKSSYALILQGCDSDRKRLEQLDTTKEALYKSNSALTVNNYSVQSLTNKINELEASRAYLNSQLEKAYADNNALRTRLNEYEQNKEVFAKLAYLEKKKEEARMKAKDFFDQRTMQQFRQDNEMIAQETQEQILDLQKQFKCLRGS